jgi:hypothetical protein
MAEVMVIHSVVINATGSIAMLGVLSKVVSFCTMELGDVFDEVVSAILSPTCETPLLPGRSSTSFKVDMIGRLERPEQEDDSGCL